MTSRRLRKLRQQNSLRAQLERIHQAAVPIRVPDCGDEFWPDAMVWSPPAGEVRAEP